MQLKTVRMGLKLSKIDNSYDISEENVWEYLDIDKISIDDFDKKILCIHNYAVENNFSEKIIPLPYSFPSISNKYIRKKRQTIKKEFTIDGIGLHTGKNIKMVVKPCHKNNGIVFIQSNLPPIYSEFFLDYKMVKDTKLCTKIFNKYGKSILTVEHILSAFHGVGIDDAIVEISDIEIPFLDGSSHDFVKKIVSSGISKKSKNLEYIKILKPITVQENDKFITIEPYDGLNISTSIDFPTKHVSSKELDIEINPDNFIKQISQNRTFTMSSGVKNAIDFGIIKGGSLKNAVVFDNDIILNPTGLRDKDECIKHKILDIIGDIFVANKPILGKIKAHKTGHYLNNILLRKIFEDENNYKIVSF